MSKESTATRKRGRRSSTMAGLKRTSRSNPVRALSHNFMDHSAVNVSQPKIATGVAVRQLVMIQA